jgi:hypothetical protein
MQPAKYPPHVEVVPKGPRVVSLGWWHQFRMEKSNDFYSAHPELWTPSVEVVVPDSVREAFRYQADEAMLTAMPEYAHIADLLADVSPSNVLELACGIGRCSVYLRKQCGWNDTRFTLVDSTMPNENAKWGVDEKGRTDFYNNLASTNAYCEANGLTNRRVIDAGELNLDSLEFFDLAYAFMSFGFHWDLNHYLHRILPRMLKGSLMIFGTRGYDQKNFREFTEKQIAGLPEDVDIVRDVRVPERMKASVLVLKKKGRP